uniref:Uncharacterized protein n=1 Tax=Aegilops tauschii subsp. strangulata TaxID=200361 RepID=A0A453H726_AEGTS
MKRYFSSVAATEVSTPGVLAGGNEGAERSEATPENETNAEMGPPPLTSNNPPSISTRESNIPDSARGQLREVERAFSAMSIIKTELRNKMGDDWLNYSMVCNIEREIFAKVDDDAIIYRFQAYRFRKGTLPPRSSKFSTLYNDNCSNSCLCLLS